jgi:4-amino-4-deoxy-L-arabinose transferase-like glycosyltransferase
MWIWRPGIQSDEALFASGVYPPFYDKIRIFKHDYAVMIMSYVGALKGHLWTPIFKLWGTNATTIRLPALIAGALSVWVFYRLLLGTLGVRVALLGCALLATDVVYLLTMRWDWGPVALQHLLLVSGMYCVVLWRQGRRLWWLGAGFFIFGLALWDKALFVWSLAGLGVAVSAVFPRELWGSLRWRPMLAAVLGFGLGSFLFVRFNVRNDFITFRSNTVWTTKDLSQKVHLLRATLNGSALFGSIMRDDWEQPMREPESALERAVVALSVSTGMRRYSVQGWLFAGSLLLLPLVWRTPARKAILFSLVFMMVTWAQMAFVQNAGGGAHHSILLWPMPQIVMAAAIGYASLRLRRGAMLAAGLVAVCCVSNALVLSTYYTNLIRNGGSVVWTDAIYRASDALKGIDLDHLCVTDWGFMDNLRPMHEGRLNICVAEDPLTEATREFSLRQITNPRIYFIGHTAGNEIQPGLAERIEKFASAHGYRRQVVGVYPDSNGRRLIEVFVFRRQSGS